MDGLCPWLSLCVHATAWRGDSKSLLDLGAHLDGFGAVVLLECTWIPVQA